MKFRLFEKASKIFRHVTDKAGISDFARDAQIVEDFARTPLTREQFNQYSNRFLLRSEFGTSGRLRRSYRHLDYLGKFQLGVDILARLYQANVVLDQNQDCLRFFLSNARGFGVEIPEVYTRRM